MDELGGRMELDSAIDTITSPYSQSWICTNIHSLGYSTTVGETCPVDTITLVAFEGVLL